MLLLIKFSPFLVSSLIPLLEHLTHSSPCVAAGLIEFKPPRVGLQTMTSARELASISIVRHVTGNDKDYLRKIPRVVW